MGSEDVFGPEGLSIGLEHGIGEGFGAEFHMLQPRILQLPVIIRRSRSGRKESPQGIEMPNFAKARATFRL